MEPNNTNSNESHRNFHRHWTLFFVFVVFDFGCFWFLLLILGWLLTYLQCVLPLWLLLAAVTTMRVLFPDWLGEEGQQAEEVPLAGTSGSCCFCC